MGTLVFQATLGGSVNLIGPNTASTINFTLPSADGSSGQALTTNGSGTLSFATVTTGAAGSTTQVQYNSSGAFAGSANLTFNGTTLTAANTSITTSETLSYGTANGVTYLNGSKVLTSGSALTFDGTNLGFGGNLNSTLTSEFYLQSPAGSNFVGINQTSGYVRVAAGNAEVLKLSNTSAIFSLSSSEQMRLTSTGLGIGTSSPSYRLSAQAASANTSVANFSGANPNRGLTIKTYQSNGGDDCGVEFNAANNASGYGAFRFVAASTTFATIDYLGNVGIGTSSPSAKLHVFTSASTADQILEGNGSNNGANLYFYADISGSGNKYRSSISGINASGSALTFSTTTNGNTAPTERARIDPSGNLLVAKTSTNVGVVGCELRTDGTVYSTKSASTNATETLGVYSTGASAYRFYVGMAGTVYATSTTITAISDQRLKENIRDLDDGLDVVLALKPRKFDWKAGKGQNIKNARGFIAQEFETVLPDMIEEWRDPAPEGEEAYKAINANLIPTLVKAIQEQQAIIQQLQADVAALKG